MVFEDVFETTIYPNLKTYIEQNNTYNAKVTKAYPQDSKVFPIIPIRLLPITNSYNNFSYGEETYSFGIDIEVYAVDITKEEEVVENSVVTENEEETENEGTTPTTPTTTTITKKVSRKTVCDDLVKLIVNYLKETYRLTIKVRHDVPNEDTNVYRDLIRVTGTLDTKYGLDNLVIYPW